MAIGMEEYIKHFSKAFKLKSRRKDMPLQDMLDLRTADRCLLAYSFGYSLSGGIVRRRLAVMSFEKRKDLQFLKAMLQSRNSGEGRDIFS